MIGGDSHELLSLPIEGTDRAATRKERFGQEYKKGNYRRNQVMKKLLTILAMALALCMLCGFALAADDSVISRDDLNRPSRVHDILNEGKYEIIDIKIDKEPTCSTVGIATVKCNNPAHKDYIHLITIPKLPHTWQDTNYYYEDAEGTIYAGDETILEDAEFCCIHDLYQERYCAVCGELDYKQVNWKNADDHEYVMGKVTTEPTCYSKGVRTAYCKHCGKMDPGWTEEVDYAPHDFSEKEYVHGWIEFAPNCINGMKATYVLKCKYCGLYEDTDRYYGPWTKEEWEGDGPWTIHTATIKGAAASAEYTEYDPVDDNGHTWKNLTKDVRTNPCETLYKTDVCINCAEKRHIKFEGGKDANYVIIGQVRIDCEHYYDEYQCTECLGKVHENKFEEVTIEKEEDFWHVPDWTNAVMSTSPTCMEDGEWSTVCLDCGKAIKWPEPATGHAWTEFTLAIVGSDGYDIYVRTCLVCGMTDELVTPSSMPADTTNTYEYKYDLDPWCEAPGFHVYESTDTSLPNVYVPFGAPLGHNWVKVDEDSVEPTCVDDGLLVEKCLRCGAWQSKLVPATGHSFELVEAKEPTCVDEGNEAYNKCTVCEAIFNEAETEELAEIPVLAATGVHTWDTEKIDMIAGAKCGEHTKMVRYCKYCPATTIEENGVVPHNPKLVEAVPATCVAEGTAAYYKCDRCDKIFADEAAETELTEAPKTEIDPKNHAAELTLVPEVAATCTKDGVKAYYVCEKCLKTYSDAEGETEIAAPEAIPATGHDFSVLISTTEATCKADGVNVYKCSKCDELKSEPIAFTGTHTLVLVPGKAATCKDTGLKDAYKCSVCDKLFADAEGKTEIEAQEVIPADATAHVWVEEVITAPTCKTTGVTLKTCSVCGLIEKIDTAKLDHVYDEGVVTTPAEPGVAGVKTFTCTLCGDTYTEEIPALPIPADYKLVDVKFEGTMLTGKIEHVDGTEFAEKLGVRVTFFIEGNVYMTTAATIYEDGTFEAEGAGVIEHVTVAAYATNKVVNPQGLKDVTCFGSTEFDVK